MAALKKSVRGWFPKENDKIGVDTKTVITTDRKKQTSPFPWLGLSATVGFFFVFLTWLGRYRSLWQFMTGGAITGFILGSLIGIIAARMSVGTTKGGSRPWLGSAIIIASLLCSAVIAFLSNALMQGGYIEADIFLLLMNLSFGFFASFCLVAGLTERYIRSRRA
jgi:hypothetical protein